MESTPWIMISIVILLILGVFAMIWTKKTKTPLDYYAFFIMGIVWLIIGIPTKNYSLWSLGLIFTIVGLANKSKWEANRHKWKNLNNKEQKIKMAVIIILGIILLVGFVAFYFTSR